jgi:hypothetical protein
MRDQITNDVSTCTICQTQKKQSKKYGLLPEKEAEAMPWDRLCVNLIGTYNINSNVKGVKIPPLKCVTMIDPATGWFKIKQYGEEINNSCQHCLARMAHTSSVTFYYNP